MLFRSCLIDQALYDSLSLTFADADRDGVTPHDGDCDDADPSSFPGADEICDLRDNDCDGTVDEDPVGSDWYTDDDGDGFGADGTATATCLPSDGSVSAGGDCDDTDRSVSPGESETCNGQDDDCNGTVDDDALDASTWYTDADGDGYGLDAASVASCEQPGGTSATGGDCDDGDADAAPDQAERCDDSDVDEDCDGQADDDDTDTIGTTVWFIDYDGDGYGSDAYTVVSCDEPDGYTATMGDCDDAEPEATPGGIELCNDGVDNDCDASSNNCSLAGDYDLVSSYAEFDGREDGDGFGAAVAAGDRDGDGLPDLLVVAKDDDRTSTDGGGFYQLQFPTGTEAFFAGAPAAETRAGEDLAAGLDLDGDGLAEVVIGAPAADDDAGAAYLVHGSRTGEISLADADAVLLGSASGDALGTDVALLDDIDGDGVREVGTTAYGYGSTGIFQAWNDPTGSPDPDFEIVGESAQILVRGMSAGDLDGDGAEDLVLTAPGAGTDARGEVYVLYGPVASDTPLSAVDGTRSGIDSADYAGYELAPIGDATGDGLPDLAIAAPYGDDSGTDLGVVYLVEGPMSGDSSLSGAFARFVGESDGDSAGWSVAGGDVDGNGYADLLIGAPDADGSVPEAGCAYLILTPAAGRVDLGMADARFLGVSAGDSAGRSVALADLDGDGLADLVTGARGVDDAGTDVGAVYVELGLGL